ncbi:hypothetical protein GTQ38_04105 [Flavobacteriaceae bacterium R33]|uniref:Uncharacterized protein n=2 Tax=Poritiphilus flavus TaxID=2697053 RepID=A0A6L9E9K9_9FLAO|nr:hypothetical protein [Poritiphilus flavus]
MRTLFTSIFLLASVNLMLAQQENCGCCTEDHTAFDFWVGSWTVTNADGTAAGQNTIEKIENGCVLKESWKSAKGQFTGSSMNFFNKQSGSWEQLWIDNQGSHLKLKGNRKGNQMILSSDEFTHTDGKTYVNRITWTMNEDGTVRQLWEVLHQGEVANVAFDGLYKRAK